MNSYTFLWREHAAPAITPEWLRSARARFGPICVFIDSADLIINEIVSSRDGWTNEAGVVLIVSCHDRVWWTSGASISSIGESILFHGITEGDAKRIAESWDRFDLLPSAYAQLEHYDAVDATAKKLFSVAHGIEGTNETTLMGAILATRSADGLQDRVNSLIQRLSLQRATTTEDINMGHIFAAICLVQDCLDPDGTKGEGISKNVLAAIVDKSGAFPDSRILTILGKEAMVSFAGERVYSRHPSIAHQVVSYLRTKNELRIVCFYVGRAAGRLRAQNTISRSLWASAYSISKNLHHEPEALAAATGAIQGSPHSFQASLDLLSVLRKYSPEKAKVVAEDLLLRRSEYDEVDECIRIFLNEYSRSALKCNQPEVALGAAALGFGGNFMYTLDSSQASYFLKTFYDASLMLRVQNPERAGDIPELTWSIANRVCNQSQVRLIAGGRRVEFISDGISGTLLRGVSSLQSRLVPLAESAASNLGIEEYFTGNLDFTWLRPTDTRA